MKLNIFFFFIFLFFLNFSGSIKTNPIIKVIEEKDSYLEQLTQDMAPKICPICFEPIEDMDLAQTLPCHGVENKAKNHTFHMWCIDPWLLENTTCPVCRSEVGILKKPQKNLFHTTMLLAASFYSFDSIRYFIAHKLKNNEEINDSHRTITPLHVTRDEKIIKLIILSMLYQNPNADLNPRDSSGITPLHNISANGSLNLIQFIVKKMLQQNFKANINPARTSDSATPLHRAVLYKHPKIVIFFINTMLNQNPFQNINPEDSTGCTPLDLAKQIKATNIANFIEKSLIKQKEMQEAIRLNENIKYFRNQNL